MNLFSKASMALLASATIAIGSSPLEAALPPLYQSIKELYTILQLAELPYYLDDGQPIEAIRRTDNGWAISTKSKEVIAEVVPLPSSGPGPQRFSIKWHDDSSN